MSLETGADGKPVLGDSKLRELIYSGNTQEPAAEADLGLLLRFQGPQGLSHRNVFMRGIWDSVESNGGGYLPNTQGWSSAMNQYCAALVAHPVGWIHSVKAQKRYVLGYEEEETSNCVVITCEPGTFGMGPYQQEVVRFSKINQPRSHNSTVRF